jgi:hypothetical protein
MKAKEEAMNPDLWRPVFEEEMTRNLVFTSLLQKTLFRSTPWQRITWLVYRKWWYRYTEWLHRNCS